MPGEQISNEDAHTHTAQRRLKKKKIKQQLEALEKAKQTQNIKMKNEAN